MKKNILVTGGAGYIGSIVVDELVKNKQSVLVVDNLSQGHKKAVNPKVEFVKLDLSDKKALEKLFKKYSFEGIMHFASHTLVGESLEKPFLYLGENVRNALNLLETAVSAGTKKFILSSTANLFDNPKKIPIAESENIVPGSPYGEGKSIIERILFWLDRTQDLRFAALRYFNAAGASLDGKIGEDHRPETHLIPVVLSVAQGARKKLTIFGDDYDTPDGTCVRDYIHVVDLAQAHILAYEALEKGSRTYNLGSGKGYSIKEVIQTCREITGHEIPAVVGPRRPGDPAILVASSAKIQKELGWKPKYGLKEIIESAYSWHKNNPRGYSG